MLCKNEDERAYDVRNNGSDDRVSLLIQQLNQIARTEVSSMLHTSSENLSTFRAKVDRS